MKRKNQLIISFAIWSCLIISVCLIYGSASAESKVMWGDQYPVLSGIITDPGVAEIITLHHEDEIKPGYIIYAQCVQQSAVVVIFSDPGIQLVVFDCNGTFQSGYYIPDQWNSYHYQISTGLSPDGSILLFNFKAGNITRLKGELTSFYGCEIYQPTQRMMMNPGIRNTKSDWSVSCLKHDLLQVTHIDGRTTTLLREPSQWSVWNVGFSNKFRQQQNWIHIGSIIIILALVWFFLKKVPHAPEL